MTIRLLSVRQVADILGCSTKTVGRRIRAGEIAVVRDHGLVRISSAAVDRYIRERTTPAMRDAG